MSVDRTETEYHLTLNGWVKGSFWVYGRKTEDVSAPADRVETWIEERDLTSGWAPAAVSWRKVWESSDVTAEVKGRLSREFPRPERPMGKPFPKRRRKLADFA